MPAQLQIESDSHGLVNVGGATNIIIEDFAKEKGVEKLIKIFNRGLDNRVMRATDVNEASSRSHLLFSIKIEAIEFNKVSSVGKLTFIDLAGSERLAQIGFEENLYEEALFIN
jgi:hypothetical protein